MTLTSKRGLANRVTGGRLDELLRTAGGKEGVPFQKLAADLYNEHRLLVSTETLRRWARDVEAEDRADAPQDAA